MFNRPCADEEPARVKAWARMETPRGEARAAVAVLAHARATRTGTVRVEVRLQRLEIDAGPEWADAPFTVRLAARSPHAAAQSGAFATWHEHEAGERRFRTDEAGTAHWITFVEPGEEAPAGSESAYRTGPDLSLDAAALRASGPRDEIALALVLRNAMNTATLDLAGPRVRVLERIWAAVAPPPQPLGMLATLNPAQEAGLLDTLRRGDRYRKCTEKRRAGVAVSTARSPLRGTART